MNLTPSEKKQLDALLDKISVSGAHKAAVFANEYYLKVRDLAKRQPETTLSGPELDVFKRRVAELRIMNLAEQEARDFAFKEVLAARG